MESNLVKGTFASNGTLVIPKGYSIKQIDLINTTANAVTGGIKIGTTSGGVDVVVALAVGASQLQTVLDSALLLRIFSTSADTTLFVQTVTLWNSASVDVFVHLNRLSQ